MQAFKLTQYYLEMRLVNFGLVALLSSYMYGMICSPRWRLPAIQSPAKTTTGYEQRAIEGAA